MQRPRETLAPPPHFAAWDHEALAPEDAQRIATVIRYRVDTFYLPTIFEYDFDADGRLIGKYVYN
ncbi:MAG: hypothetical protein KIS92_06145 [Planctomycetota bacterium]|nr:hypothetical protein [Planctomycetota bacterium]